MFFWTSPKDWVSLNVTFLLDARHWHERKKILINKLLLNFLFITWESSWFLEIWFTMQHEDISHKAWNNYWAEVLPGGVHAGYHVRDKEECISPSMATLTSFWCWSQMWEEPGMCSKCPSWARKQTSGCHCSKTGDRTGNTKAVFCMARLSPSWPQPAMARL